MKPEQPIASLPVIVIGGGGHAKVLISTLLLQHRNVLGFVDLKPDSPAVLGVTQLGNDDAILMHSPHQVRLVNGIGSIGSTEARRNVYEGFRHKQYIFESVIHPSAIIALDVDIESGAQVMAGAVIQPGSRLGSNAIINTGACIDHDCLIGAHAHIAPGATLSGNVTVGQGAHIGTGACIVQGVSVGTRAIVGAGAVVLRNVPDEITVIGVPAAPVNTFAVCHS